MKIPSIVVLDVSEDNVLKGLRHNSCFCPVALAIKEKFPGLDYVRVAPSSSFVEFDVQKWEVCGGRRLKDFITAFDGGNPVQPVSLVLHFDEIQPKPKYVKPKTIS